MAEPNTLLIIAHPPTAEVVRYLLAFSHTTFLANGPVAWVEEVMVAEQARRGGIGRRLIATAEDWSASIGAAYIALATRGRLASTSLWDTPNLPRSFAS